MSEETYTKNVGFIGGLSVLICSITGPAVISIPTVFQASGWFITLFFFMLISTLANVASLFLIEALTKFPGNENFERNIEFTVLVHQFYGRYWYYGMHAILYGSIQSFNIASLIAAVAQMDSAILNLFGATCGYGITPVSGLYCVSQESNTNSPFGDNYMLFTVGYIIVLMFMVPLLSVDLNDNMIVQFASFAFLLIVMLSWFIQSIQNGFNSSLIPAFGENMIAAIPNILFNFTLANTVPSWVNITHKNVPIQRTLWVSTYTATAFYIFVGIIPGFSFAVPSGTNVIQAIATSGIPAASKTWNTIVNVLFSFLVYLTSIPVAMIIVELNLVSSKLCSKSAASFYAIVVPFIVIIPMLTGTWNDKFQTWTSIFLQAPCNFFAPFMVYLFLSKRNLVMQQSVIDELEFLDLEAGVKKRGDDDDDDFDYIYHLPHADLTRLPRRDPFARQESEHRLGGSKLGDDRYVSTSGLSVGSRMSIRSISKRQVRAMLGNDTGNQGFSNLVANKMNASHISLNAPEGFIKSRRGSNASTMGVPGPRMGRRGSTMPPDGGYVNPMTNRLGGPRPPERRASAFGPGAFKIGKVVPTDHDQNTSVNLLINDEETGEITGGWRALPQWWTDKVPNRITASVSLISLVGLTLFVFVYDVMYGGH